MIKRSKAFFNAAIRTHRERMFATFERAKKNTRRFLEENSPATENKFLLRGKGLQEKGVRFTKETYSSVILWLGRLSSKTDRLIPFVRDSFHCIKSFFFETYARLVMRGEYTKRSLLVLFVIAIFVGGAIKALAVRNITIGFEDYTLAPKETLYDINLLQQKIIDRGDALLEDDSQKGGVCSDPE